MKRFLKDLNKYKGYILYSARAQLNAELANSWLGGIWWVLEPVLYMFVYMFVFTVVFQRQTQYSVAFITLGLAYWRFFNNTVQSSITLVKRYRAVISKVYIPKFVFVCAQMLVNAFKMMFSLIPVAVLMVWYRVPLTWHIPTLIPVTAVLFVLAFGISCLFMHIGVYIEDMDRLMKVVLQLLFYFSGVFYPINELVEPQLAQLMFHINPIALILFEARNALLYGIGCQWSLLGVYLLIGIGISYFGVRTVYKSESKYIKVI